MFSTTPKSTCCARGVAPRSRACLSKPGVAPVRASLGDEAAMAGAAAAMPAAVQPATSPASNARRTDLGDLILTPACRGIAVKTALWADFQEFSTVGGTGE